MQIFEKKSKITIGYLQEKYKILDKRISCLNCKNLAFFKAKKGMSYHIFIYFSYNKYLLDNAITLWWKLFNLILNPKKYQIDFLATT